MKRKFCNKDGCNMTHYAGGMCLSHYNKSRYKYKKKIDIDYVLEPVRSILDQAYLGTPQDRIAQLEGTMRETLKRAESK